MIELRHESTTITIDPEHGGRVRQIDVAGTAVLVGDDGAGPLAWGCYPMVPWPGRIRDGRFAVDSRTVRMPPNEHRHAMHGVGFAVGWTILETTADSATLTLDLHGVGDWPFGGIVTHRFAAEPNGLWCEISIEPGAEAMPAELGWHPWLLPPSSLDFEPSRMYRRDADGVTTGDLIAPPPPPWDDCFLNDRPVRLRYADHSVTVTSDCQHWVVFTESSRGTCVEPQSAPPDAFNLQPRVLRPGHRRTNWMRIDVDFDSDTR